MRRDPCYDHLGLRRYLFKKVLKAFHIFSFKCFTPQAFNCGQAVGVNNKILASGQADEQTQKHVLGLEKGEFWWEN